MTSFDLQAVEAGIAGSEFSGRVVHLNSVGSTNALALEAAQSGALLGVYVADEQTAGRGRGGHVWHSAADDGLYVSVLVAPPVPVAMAMWLPLVAGLAVQSAISSVTGLAVDIRWPNDLLLNGRKCGGILVETASIAGHEIAGAMLRYAVIGIGINLNHRSFPSEIALLATSLRSEGGRLVSREVLLVALLRSLEEEIRLLVSEHRVALKGPGLLERFTSASTWVQGKRVHVEENGGYTGVTDGLDARGFLRVVADDGVTRTVISGGVREQ